eukprot:comp24262_c4_seq9/m.45077 comp24262_c4_seq9/g.45077  ORF comp24262_c4_seq9/g.45077 comp24262_c4_seq9/m.45077 type:complete len:249 (-) comp24262_c4_seq9:218-964(-)
MAKPDEQPTSEAAGIEVEVTGNTFENFRPKYVGQFAEPNKGDKAQPLFKRPKDLEELAQIKKMTTAQLEEHLARNDKLLADSKFLSRLPDKGEKVRAKRQQMLDELQRRQQADEAADMLAALSINDTDGAMPRYVQAAVAKDEALRARHAAAPHIPAKPAGLVRPEKVQVLSLAESLKLAEAQAAEAKARAQEAARRQLEKEMAKAAADPQATVYTLPGRGAYRDQAEGEEEEEEDDEEEEYGSDTDD